MSKLCKLLNIERFQNFTVTNIDKNINELLLNNISVKNFVYLCILYLLEFKLSNSFLF